jgi:hypothetical protein
MDHRDQNDHPEMLPDRCAQPNCWCGGYIGRAIAIQECHWAQSLSAPGVLEPQLVEGRQEAGQMEKCSHHKVDPVFYLTV